MEIPEMPDFSEGISRYDRIVGQRQSAQRDVSLIKDQIAALDARITDGEMVVSLFRSLMDAEISDTITQIDKLLTEALAAVFPDQRLSVKSEVQIVRNKVGINMLTQSAYDDGSIVEGQAGDSFGGAVNTVQSLLLRIFVILKRGLRPVLVMDETLPAIEGDYIVQMASFLSILSQRFGFDILLITHNPSLVDSADHAYRIQNKNGYATYKKIK